MQAQAQSLYADALSSLAALGISNPQPGKSYRVTPARAQAQILSVARGAQIVTPNQRSQGFNFPGGFEPICIFGFEPWCWNQPSVVTDPTYYFNVLPLHFDNVKFYVDPFNAGVEGDIANNLANNSTPGQSAQTNKKTGATKDPQDIPGSADMTDGSFLHAIATDVQGISAQVANAVGALSSQLTLDVTGHWQAAGPWSAIKAALSWVTAGKIRTTHGYDLTMNMAAFLDRQGQQFSQHIDVEAWLPINGDVGMHWSRPF